PQLVRASQQRDIRKVFPIGEADDAREAVGRSEVVRDVELLEPEHARASPGGVKHGGAPHAADADDDYVVATGVHRAARWPSVIALKTIVSTPHATIVATTP